jgi:hypothetical protein
VVSDLGEASASGPFGADACEDIARHGHGAPRRRERSLGRPWRSTALLEESLELVGWNESSTPRHLDRLNVRKDTAVERGAADAQRLGGLGAGVGEALGAGCLADDHSWLRVPTLFLGAPLLTASRHQFAVHKR